MVVSAMAEICGLLFMDAGHLEMTADLKKLVSVMGEQTGRVVAFSEVRLSQRPSFGGRTSLAGSFKGSFKGFNARKGQPWKLSASTLSGVSNFAYVVYSPTNAAAEAHVLSSMLGKHVKRCALLLEFPFNRMLRSRF